MKYDNNAIKISISIKKSTPIKRQNLKFILFYNQTCYKGHGLDNWWTVIQLLAGAYFSSPFCYRPMPLWHARGQLYLSHYKICSASACNMKVHMSIVVQHITVLVGDKLCCYAEMCIQVTCERSVYFLISQAFQLFFYAMQ